MADPEKTGDIPPEMETIPKSEMDAIRKRLHDSEGYTTRKLETMKSEYEARIEQLEEKMSATGDKNLDAIRKQVIADEKAVKAQQEALEVQRLHDVSLTLAAKYGIDASELADCKTEVEIRAKAAELGYAQKPGPQGIDLGGKGLASGRIYKRSEVLSQFNPTGLTPAEIHNRRLELEKAAQEGRLRNE